MKTFVSLLASAVAATALAASDFERFQKVVGKYAVNLAGQESPRGLCLCQTEGDLARSVGFLLRGSSAPIGNTSLVTTTVSCFIPSFDESGARGSTFICTDFVPLVK